MAPEHAPTEQNPPSPPGEEAIRLRPALDALPAYVAGRPAPQREDLTVYKVSSNESPFGPIDSVRQAVIAALEGANRYPDMMNQQLRQALAAEHGVTPEEIVVSTGAVAVTGDLVRAVVDPSDEVVFPWRSFEAYPILVGAQGGVSRQIPLTETFEHDLDAMVAAVTDRTTLMILCTPNNPTGPILTTEQVRSVLGRVPSHVVVALDEAYREFVEPELRIDAEGLFREFPNLLVLRTFSKAHGLAGLRVGYALAHPRLADALLKVTLPFGTNLLAQAAALASLEPEVMALMTERTAHLRSERSRVMAGLAEQGWELPASQGNFVFFPLGEQCQEFTDFCADRGLVVRRYGDDGVRITIAEDEANDRILEVCGAWRQR
ncbi:histidinol-phosphate transaminase [Brachybacterium sp. EF45031]|uniref:histidinol-phosphate transaminase n=1 Tax=Brachybacterium sillae TaxID=2810536 RepID=UPI00217D2A94|nr:histidinol-phosphate transaminase [Brachybacterium sillae]MCS6712177.1 histidinol-phosphate transaminase [Brachybacterium sillae]